MDRHDYSVRREYPNDGGVVFQGFERGKTLASEVVRIEEKSIRAFVGKGARSTSLPSQMVSSATGHLFWQYGEESYKLPNGHIMSLFLAEEGMPTLAKSQYEDYITVSPSGLPVGYTKMCLWFEGEGNPFVEVPNKFDYPLGDVFTSYKREGKYPYGCPEGETMRDYINRAMSAWKPAEQYRLVNYGKINIPAKQRIGNALETDVWVTYTWFEFEPIK